MEKKITKKLLAILMIIIILATDFYVLGSNLITYASQINSETSNQNIEFSVYFQDGKNKVDSIEQSIKSTDLKLYAEITVNGEDGYIEKNATIEIQNSNFNIISSNKGSFKGNKVILNQINAGETVKVELGIEPIISDKITTDFLYKTSTVKFTGSYKYSEAEDGVLVEASKSACVNYKPDAVNAELTTEIITNKVFADKRIVQLLIKSRLTDNQYPVEQTVLNVGIPKLNVKNTETEEVIATAPKDVSVLAIGKLATNGEIEVNTTNYKVSEDKENLQITLKNKEENGKINWVKNAYDELVVTFIYPSTVVNASSFVGDVTSKIKAYGVTEPYVAAIATKHLDDFVTLGPNINEIIIGRTEIITDELYKGQLYANTVTEKDVNIEYQTKTTLAVTKEGIVDKITITEGQDLYETEKATLAANTKYVSTEINKEKMLAILGQGGSIEIKNGEITTTINKDTPTENGNILIVYGEKSTSKLVITAKAATISEAGDIESALATAGVLEIHHTKAIVGDSYNRDQIKTVKTLKTTGNLVGTITVENEGKNEDQKVIEKTTETTASSIELKETISKAELTIDKTNWSTTEENEVTVGITLVTDGIQYDLYKDPTIELQLPSAVKNVEFITAPSKVYADEFTTIGKKYDSANNIVTINIKGEQTAWPKSSVTQAYVQLKLNITLDTLAIAQTDKITMEYTNANATQYEGGTIEYGVIEQTIEISAPSQLIKMFNVSLNENTSLTETILQRIKDSEAGKKLDFDIELINNKDSDMSDVKILGKLPTTGNTISGENVNTLETTLANITAENATIYYTKNVDATEDIDDTTNGWTKELSANAKLYLIKLDTLARGDKYTATVTVQMPTSITENALSYTEYEVIYDILANTGVRENSRKIGLVSSMAAAIKTEITAQVGQDILKSGDTVKEGEVINYTLTVKNEGTETLENVQLKLDVPEGTVLVKPKEEEAEVENEDNISDSYYYEEITSSDKIAEMTSITIPELTTKVPYIMKYEVRVNKGGAGTKISNIPTVIYDESEIEGAGFRNTIQESNIRVTIKKGLPSYVQSFANSSTVYALYIENLSNSAINNLEMQVLSDTFKLEKIADLEGNILNYEEELGKISIKNEIEANEMIYFLLYGSIAKDATEINTSVVVNDSNGKYRSNKIKEEIQYADVTISLTSPQNNGYIKQGDTVEYNINVKNTGDIECSATILDEIPDYLQVRSITLKHGDKLKEETISNYIYQSVTLKPGEVVKLNIIAEVGYIPELYHGKTITNVASVDILNGAEVNSEIITHVLKANDESVENVISGFAWFDKNENGQKDRDEEALSGITVELYDCLTGNYLVDEDGNVIQTKTDSDGIYTFTKIKDGSYLIIFGYDTEKYELTTGFAEGVDTSMNSKAEYVTEKATTVAAIKTNNIENNIFNMNIGLKANTGNSPSINDTILPENPTDPENPEKPEKPVNPENPIDPEKPADPENPEKPGETQEQKIISGFAWLDEDRDGEKDANETTLSGIKIKIYDVSTKRYLTDNSGNIVESITGDNGKYTFNNIAKGSYILIFEYDTEKYEPTKYMVEGIDTTKNSKVILNKININGKEITTAVTDIISVQNDVSNINIGLKEKLTFDLELNKYISRIVVQNSKETKAYDYDAKTLAKVEIHKKQLQGSLVVLEYTIKVKNNGEISGYVKNIVDYLPSGLTFSSELNKEWYLSESYLYTKSLENVELKPGEEKEIKLILTKTMTSENTGLINNRAEIYQDYNKYGNNDIDSTPNNQIQDEDDFGSVDVIIGISTGGSNIAYIILLMTNVILIAIAIRLMIKNNIIKISNKRERR